MLDTTDVHVFNQKRVIMKLTLAALEENRAIAIIGRRYGGGVYDLKIHKCVMALTTSASRKMHGGAI